MRIAHVGLRAIDYNCSGGIERHVLNLSLRQANLGHKVTICSRDKYCLSEPPPHVNIVIMSMPAIYTKHLETISHTAICAPCVMVGYDVVHFHALGPSLFSWLPRMFSTKVIVTVHGLDFQRPKWNGMAKAILRAGAWTSAKCPHQTIVVSRVLQRHYEEIYGRSPVYIPNGVTAPSTRPLDALAKRFGISKHKYILSLGRLVPEKGLHTLIEAFKRIRSDVRLVIAGDSSHSDDYVRRLRSLAQDDGRIIFTGSLHGEEKDEAFSNAMFFVLPSELEGMPITLLEAMSYGCPVIASDIPECREVSQAPGLALEPEGYACGIFKVGNLQSLIVELERMLSDPSLPTKGQLARKHVLQTYNWDLITHRTLEVYGQAMSPLLSVPAKSTSMDHHAH